MTHVLHDATVLCICGASTAQSVHPSSTGVALECMLTHRDDFVTYFTQIVAIANLHLEHRLKQTGVLTSTVHFIRFYTTITLHLVGRLIVWRLLYALPSPECSAYLRFEYVVV